MAAANITIKVDSELARAAKVLAAQRGTSVSRLVAEELERLVHRNQDYQAAKRRALRQMGKGSKLGWKKPLTRDELHERR